jgi:DNA (cytosine-5)-methyltransferase 1
MRRLFEANSESDPTSYIVKSEAHRIPQARHRLILLGVRSDIERRPQSLRISHHRMKMWAAISDLPRLRSRLSNGHDSGEKWVETIRLMANRDDICKAEPIDGTSVPWRCVCRVGPSASVPTQLVSRLAPAWRLQPR